MTPPSICLHELVASQARRTPDAVAVIHGREQVTFRALRRRANRLAARLHTAGVRPEVTVGVCLEPSVDLVAALLAVLEAGGAYLPIAPATPPNRLAQLVADTRPRVVVASRPDELPGLDCPVLPLDDGEPTAGPVPSSAFVPRPTPDNLAYVLFTSGSTGTPKGVMVPHRGICNTLVWRQVAYPFTATDRVLLTFSFVFDASIFEIFQPLIGGASIVIPDTGLDGDAALIVDAIRRHRITVLGVVPSTLKRLVKHPDLGRCDSLRAIICGGEPLTAALVAAIHFTLDVELVNGYGPTEASMEATAATCAPGQPVTIGNPIANMRTHLLDDQLEPVEDGLVGQLYLAGAGLARGSWGAPAETAERFVPDPSEGAIGTRMYRTGDRCRRRTDGALEFVGREDRQVKLGGQRIELGEVEVALQRHPAVAESVVMLDRNRGEPALVAYLVAATASPPSRRALRRHLAGWLPRSMIPSAFVMLDEIPRTASGKVDTSGLAAIRRHPSQPATGLQRRPPLEQFIAGLWTDVLGVRPTGPEDDFFELGGTSIHAAVLARRLEKELHEYVYSVAIYDAPTIGELASYVRTNYPVAASRFEPADPAPPRRPTPTVTEDDLAGLRGAVRLPHRRPAGRPEAKNPSAAFILTPPRCGSTLLRTMLGAHPALFAPPELQLLNFDTLRERRAALGDGRDGFWLQGTVRALIELLRCDVDIALGIMDDCEANDLSVKDFYRLIQDRLGETILIDKTPTYSLHRAFLDRAEQYFDEPKYIHLVRHPAAAIASFREVKLHVFFRPFLDPHYDCDSADFAEIVWTVSQQNIVEFLAGVPAHRQHRVRFEELVATPEPVLEGVAAFLDVPFDHRMRDPYGQDPGALMTDAVHPIGRMLGDVKFAQHGAVRADVGWRSVDGGNGSSLGAPTIELSRRLGYHHHDPSSRAMVTLRAGEGAPALVFVHPAGGGISCYRPLGEELSPGQPFRALHARWDGEAAAADSVEALATGYLAELRTVQPHGPYRLGGWSFGGIVAVEMAQQLRSAGEEIALLVLISSNLCAPDAPPDALRPAEFVVALLRELGFDAAADEASRSGLGPLLARALVQATEAGTVPPTMTFGEFRREVQRRRRLYRRHVEMARRYAPSGPVGDVVLVEPDDPRGTGRGPFMEWEAIATSVTRHVVGGDHVSMLRPPHVAALARLLQEDRCTANRPGSRTATS
jgi:amino acid adenylation domain-containing protein